MPEQELSLYQRYLSAVRRHPGDYILVKNGDGYIAFVHECWLFANALGRMPKQINGHWQLAVSVAELQQLKLKFGITEA